MMRRELNVEGMDCAGCARSVQAAIEDVPGVRSVEVRLVTEKAVVDMGEPEAWDDVERAITRAGFHVRSTGEEPTSEVQAHTRWSLTLFGIVATAILAIAGVGHGLGVFGWLEGVIPWPIWLVAALGLGYPVFKKVALAALSQKVIAHTLMTVGVAAALFAGAWVTGVLIVIFMRLGDYVESFTTNKARDSLRELMHEAPQTARVEREGREVAVPIGEVDPGESVIVRPGEKIPVDGTVTSGHATTNQAAITGESMPVEATAGDEVFAATIAQGGHLRVRTESVGEDTTFGKVVRMVEEAEAHQGRMQRWADKFSGYYLPVVLVVGAGTYIIGGDLMATVAVLVVACSCAFALATPVAMLAAIGRSAQRGFLIKGGKYLEALAQADVLLIDKTGTLTLGEPRITNVVTLDGLPGREVLRMAASAERYSEHSLAKAVRRAARERDLPLAEPSAFEAVPGQGIRAEVDGATVTVGNRKLISDAETVGKVEAPGQTPLFVEVDGTLVGVLLAADAERWGAAAALDALQDRFARIEVLTGDREATAAALAERIGVDYRASLLPEEKISIVEAYQAEGHTVVMIGDGVNDAPALAQADVGIAMGGVGTDVAIDAAHVVLMREDWQLVPTLMDTADQSLRVVKGNLLFTAVYNAGALGVAAVGYLPPILAAAMHSIPDLGILVNSSRLLRDTSDTSGGDATVEVSSHRLSEENGSHEHREGAHP